MLKMANYKTAQKRASLNRKSLHVCPHRFAGMRQIVMVL